MLIFSLCLLPQLLFSIGNKEELDPQEAIKPSINWEVLSKDITGNIKALQYNEIFDLTAENPYRIQFETKKALYVYVFLYTSRGDIIFLFPKNIISVENVNPGSTFSIPEEIGKWLILDQNTYIENLYILTVDKRQKKLEKLTEQYLSFFDSENPETDHKESIKIKLLYEIKRIDRSNNSYVVYAEKPNSFLGDVQDDEKQKELEWIMDGDDEE